MAHETRKNWRGIKIVHEFENIIDMAFVEPHPKNHGNKAYGRVFGNKREELDGWTGGVSSLKRWREFHAQGWPEGSSKASDLMNEVSIPVIRSIRRALAWGDEGEEIEMARVWSGDLDRAWRKPVKRQGGQLRGTHVRVWSSVSMNYRVDWRDALWRGVAAMVLADALENAGYRVEINAYACFYGLFELGDYRPDVIDHAMIMRVKHYDQPMSLAEVAAAVAHPSTLRTAGFAVMMSCDRRVENYLGMPYHAHPPFAEDGDIVVDSIWSRDEAVDFLHRSAAMFGSDAADDDE